MLSDLPRTFRKALAATLPLVAGGAFFCLSAPVAAQEQAQTYGQSDKEFLRQLEPGGGPPAIAEAPSRSGAETAEEERPSAGPQAGAAEAPVRRQPREELSRERRITGAQAEEFIREYLAVCSPNNLGAELSFYDRRVDYFDQGRVSLDFVARDVANYYRQWPSRSYRMIDLALNSAGPTKAAVTFRIAFRLANSRQSLTGLSEHTFSLRQTDDGLKIERMRERRLR